MDPIQERQASNSTGQQLEPPDRLRWAESWNLKPDERVAKVSPVLATQWLQRQVCP